MPGASRAEVYFISAMMVLILVLCVGAVYVFFKTYKKEMREKAKRQAKGSTNRKITGLSTVKGEHVENA